MSAIDKGEHASSVVLFGRGGVGVSVAVTFALAMALLWACIGIDDAGVCAACALRWHPTDIRLRLLMQILQASIDWLWW